MISDKMIDLVNNSSVIRAMFEEGKRLAGIYGAENVYDFSLGNPNVPAPAQVNEAIKALVDEEESTVLHGYMSNSGYEDVRAAVASSLNRRFGTDFDETNIIMTVGAAGGMNVLMKTLLNPGDEVLIPQPSFVSYLPCAVLADGVPVVINLKAENEFRLTAQELEDAITDKTKLLVLPFPNNPTGAVMTREDLEAIAEVIIRHDIYVLSDEIYSELTYAGDHVSIASLPGMKERTITMNGFSKAYAMTGWRLGYACGPREIIKQMTKVHQFAIMCAPTNSQYAAVEALRNGDDDVARMKESYNQRRNYLVHELRDMGLDCFEPYGAFYVFPSIKKFGLTSEEFATRLLEEEKVAVVPGTAFGDCGEGFLRISYAYSLDDLKLALGRVRKFVERLEQK